MTVGMYALSRKTLQSDDTERDRVHECYLEKNQEFVASLLEHLKSLLQRSLKGFMKEPRICCFITPMTTLQAILAPHFSVNKTTNKSIFPF